MPIQIFPPRGQHTKNRSMSSVWLKVAVIAGSLALLGATVLAALPYALLNTEAGRAVLLAVANRTNEAHLALKHSTLSIRPAPMLTLEDLRLVHPFEPTAPKLVIGRAELLGFRIDREGDAKVMVADSASFDQITLEAHQLWIQQQQAGRKPPTLPAQFPSQIRVDALQVSGLRYEVHQLRRGRPTQTELEGVSASFSPLVWDLKRMQATGSGRLHAEQLSLGGLRLRDLSIPELILEGERIRIPAGTAQGLGGAMTITGEVSLKGGCPLPSLHITGRGMDLGKVIQAAPEAKADRPDPAGTLSMDIRLTTQGNVEAGEVPDPVLEGTIVMEGLSVPVADKSPLAQKVLEKSPLWIDGTPARLNLGDMVANVRIADGTVRLTKARLLIQGLTLVMHGTIDQNTDALDLRLKLAPRAPDSEPTDLLSSKPEAVSGVAGHGADALLPGPTTPEGSSETAGMRADGPEELPSGASAPTQTPSSEPNDLRSRLAAGRSSFRAKAEVARTQLADQAELLKAKAAEAKSALDSKAEALKDQATHDLESARQARNERNAALKTAAATGPEALKTELDSRVEALRATIQADFEGRVARVQERVEALGQRALERFAPKLESLELCITGTTAQPVVQLCQESKKRTEAVP